MLPMSFTDFSFINIVHLNLDKKDFFEFWMGQWQGFLVFKQKYTWRK